MPGRPRHAAFRRSARRRKCAIGTPQVQPVEEVEDLGAELDRVTLVVLEVLEDREVDRSKTGPVQGVSPDRSVGAGRGLLEGARVEPAHAVYVATADRC